MVSWRRDRQTAHVKRKHHGGPRSLLLSISLWNTIVGFNSYTHDIFPTGCHGTTLGVELHEGFSIPMLNLENGQGLYHGFPIRAVPNICPLDQLLSLLCFKILEAVYQLSSHLDTSVYLMDSRWQSDRPCNE